MLTTAQAAALLDMDLRYVRRLVKDGKIKATKITPRMYLIKERDLTAYQQAHPRSKAGRPRKERP